MKGCGSVCLRMREADARLDAETRVCVLVADPRWQRCGNAECLVAQSLDKQVSKSVVT